LIVQRPNEGPGEGSTNPVDLQKLVSELKTLVHERSIQARSK
jgi:hypothetical protein